MPAMSGSEQQPLRAGGGGGGGGGVTDACAVCKILHVIECAWGSSGFKLPTV